MADQFPGVDFSQWQTWESYRTPDGREYKIIPGPTGGAYVLDVVESHRTGRPFARPNPKQVYEAADKQKKESERANSLTSQLAAPAGMLAGLYATKKLSGMELPSIGDLWGGGVVGDKALAVAPEGLLGQAGQAGGDALISTAMPGVGPTTANAAFLQGAGAAPAPVLPEVVAVEPGLLGGFGPMASSAQGLGALGAVAGATYLGGKAAYDMLKGEKPGLPGRVILGMATGGLSEVANGFLGGKSTRDYAKDNTKQLLESAGDDQNAINYVKGMREQYNSAPPDPSKPFAGKYGSFDEYQAAGLDARDLSGVYGNISTYGAKEWAGLTQDQREQITAENIKRNNYASKKGDVIIQDKKAAQEAWNAILKPVAPVKGAAPLQTLPVTKGPLLIDPSAADAKKKELLSKAMSR